jgi:N-acetylglucosamine kinase-like BadF-type ATPase
MTPSRGATPPAQPAQPAVLAIDGGNSKADVALLGPDGSVLAAVRGPTISHQAVPLAEATVRLRALVDRVRAIADVDSAAPRIAVACLAGADYPEDIRLLRRVFRDASGASEVLVLNDTFAALRAGASRPWGIALICGQGINGAAVAVDGRRVRFAGVGDIAGDWGGGASVGMAGLAAAVRGRDGRGPRTALERTIPAAVGLRRPDAVTHAYYARRLDEERVGDLAPVVFATAADGDPVARSIVDRLADELVVMAAALARRTGLVRRDPEVVLGGGVFRTEEPGFYARLRSGVTTAIQAARIVRLESPPVLGAALLGLDALAPNGAAASSVADRARHDLDTWSATARVEMSS